MRRESLRKPVYSNSSFAVPMPPARVIPTNDWNELRSILKRLIARRKARMRRQKLYAPIMNSLDMLLAEGPQSGKSRCLSKFMSGQRQSLTLPEWRICCLHLNAPFLDALQGVEIIAGALMSFAEWDELKKKAKAEWERLKKKHGASVIKQRNAFILSASKNGHAKSQTK